jgi:Fe-S cluster assembly protein SufD
VIERYLEDFERLAREEPGPAWLRSVRRAAIDRFAAVGFPTPRDEDWHFTSVAPIAEAELRAIGEPSGDVRAEDLAPFQFGHPEWPAVVFVNGRYAPELSNPGALGAGVRVTDLASAWRQSPELLERHLTKLASPEQSAFTALNTAFMRDGTVVEIAAEAVLRAPLHLLYVADANAAKTVTHPRTLIIAGRHSSATVIESFVSLGDPTYFTNAVGEAVLEDGATLHHYKVQRESERAFHVGTTQAHQARDSHYISFSFALGAALSRTNIYTVLDGEGSGTTLNGLYMVDGEQHVDHQTEIVHRTPNCFSREHYKGILDGSSHGVFNGKVYVHPEAQKTDGKQTNNTLLLSERARIDTKPQLEIFADDVKCTHGATVGRLDATALFYMKSRGIGAESARRLLTYAFAADVIESITEDAVREGLEGLVLRRFTGVERLEGLESVSA